MRKQDLTPDVIEHIKKEKETGKTHKQVAESVSKAVKKKITYRNVQEIMSELIEKLGGVEENLANLNESIEQEQHYEVTDDHYIFFQKRPNQNTGEQEVNKFPILISVVDNIFKSFSKHGLNWSQEKILQEFEIKPELFQMIKNRLRLFKDSHIISPASLDRMTPEEQQKAITEGIDEHIRDKYRDRFVKTYEKKKDEDYIVKSKKIANIDYELEVIRTFLENYEPRKLDITRAVITNNDEITVFFADLHIGKMNTNKVLARIERMTSDIVARPEKKVNLICFGDLFETIAKGGMHQGQVESMEGLYGFDLFQKVIEVFETILASIYASGKDIKFYGLGGNHDRFTQKKEDSFAGIAALMVYEVVRKSLQNINIEINLLRETWNVLDLQGFRYIIHHGDDGANKKKPSQILWEKGDRERPNIIAMADKHHHEQLDSNSNATFVLVPGMAGENEYDRKLLLASYPGYMIVAKDYFDGTPSTTVRRFNN